VSGVHGLNDLGPAAHTTAGGGSSVGQMLALAHDVDAETVARRLTGDGSPSALDDATRSLLETVLRGEEAYVDRLATGLEQARRAATRPRPVPAWHAVSPRTLAFDTI
jgi:hypothetical protein